jgi:hypothetical protein
LWAAEELVTLMFFSALRNSSIAILFTQVGKKMKEVRLESEITLSIQSETGDEIEEQVEKYKDTLFKQEN